MNSHAPAVQQADEILVLREQNRALAARLAEAEAAIRALAREMEDRDTAGGKELCGSNKRRRSRWMSSPARPYQIDSPEESTYQIDSPEMDLPAKRRRVERAALTKDAKTSRTSPTPTNSDAPLSSVAASLPKRRVSQEELTACDSQCLQASAPKKTRTSSQQQPRRRLECDPLNCNYPSQALDDHADAFLPRTTAMITPHSSMVNIPPATAQPSAISSPSASPIGWDLETDQVETDEEEESGSKCSTDASLQQRTVASPMVVLPSHSHLSGKLPSTASFPGPMSQNSTEKTQRKRQTRLGAPRLWRSRKMPALMQDVLLLVGLVLLVFLVGHGRSMWKQAKSPLSLPNDDCIYVTGGGFSGFWFSLGRLKTLAAPPTGQGLQGLRDHKYACYSAGCLGVVATYTNRSMEDLYEMAGSIQRDWQDGTIHRYQVVEAFVDNLLGFHEDESNTLRYDTHASDGHSSASVRRLLDQKALDSIHILTSIPSDDGAGAAIWGSDHGEGMLGFEAAMQTPRDIEHLRSLLIQTTWIPYAVGSQYTHPGSGHLDGYFSTLQHPKCHKQVGLANDWTLLANILNVNLSKERVETFWNMGLAYGI